MMKTAYLIAYNISCCVGWSYVLVHCLISLKNGASALELWDHVEMALKLTQTAALLEILHSVTKLVRSPFISTLMQGM